MLRIFFTTTTHFLLVCYGEVAKAGVELVGKHDGVPLDDIADAQLLSDLLPLALISFQIDNEISYCEVQPSLMTG